MKSNLLLDTHVFLWLMNGDDSLSIDIQDIIQKTCTSNFLFLSSISVWEIAMLQKKNRISLTQPVHQWFDKVESFPFLKISPLSVSIAIESCFLPGDFHGDPADRMIVATARILNIPLLTRDHKIIAYAQEANLKVIPC